MRGNQSRTYSKLPVSSLRSPDWSFLLLRSLSVNKWLRYQDAFILYSWLPCITDTRYWRVLLQENCAVNILFCLYCWQINVLNVLFMRPFIKIFDFELMRKEQRTEEKNRTKLTLFNSWRNSTSPGPDLVPKDAFWKAIFRELENISKWKVFTNLHHADPHWTVDSRRCFTWRLLLAREPRPCKSPTILC